MKTQTQQPANLIPSEKGGLTDSAMNYTREMPRLNSLMLAYECDLASATLDFKFAASDPEKDSNSKYEIISASLVNVASILKSWDLLVAEMGINPIELEKISPPRHFGVQAMIHLSEARHPDAEQVQARLGAMREYLAE